MKDNITKQEKGTITRRKIIFQSFLGIVFGSIFFRLWNLQIVNGSRYKKLSEENRIRLLFVGGLRGLIYDNKKKVVAKNIPSYDLFVSSRSLKTIEKTLRKISFTIGVPYDSLLATFKLNLKISRFENIKIYINLNWKQVSLIEAYQEEFPKIYIDVSQVRQYLFSEYLVHLVGYTNLAGKEDFKKLSFNQVQSASFVGKSGIEKMYNKQLLGRDGKIRLEINSSNKILNTQYVEPSHKGNNIFLNINAEKQIQLYKIFGDRRGAAIVMDPHKGKVLAMCSNPSFDPNQFSTFLSKEEWKKLFQSKEGFLNNRCIQGIYSPGSTFKMLIALAALEEGLIDESYEYNCVGHYKVNRKNYSCWKKSGHKTIALVQALAQSCNTFFYQLGLELGIERIYEYAVKFGFSKLTGIDIPNEKKGVIPNKKWKEEMYKDKWYLGETIGVSIGQNYVGVTPLQLICYINAIVNGGILIQPRIVDYIVQGKNKEVIKTQRKYLGLRPKNLNLVLDGMRASVISKKGTNRRLQNNIFSAGGKTGTTQLISNQTRKKIIKKEGKLSPSLENHAWFAGFAPAYNPKYSIVVLLENGKKGTNATALAKQVFYNYFYKDTTNFG